MQVVLKSDFRDFYDFWFATTGDHFLRRYTTDGMDRFCQLDFLERHGLKTPAYGRVSALLDPLPSRGGAPEVKRHRLSRNCQKLVVYTDNYAHCGEGKLLLEPEQALAEYPYCIASEYIGDCPGLSWRYLQVGMHGFWIEYKSNYDWRSNCGDLITMEIIGKEDGWCCHPNALGAVICKLPLFAIDFVVGKELYAIDFNVAPGIRGTGVEDYLTSRQIAESIEEAYFTGTYLEDIQRYYVR